MRGSDVILNMSRGHAWQQHKDWETVAEKSYGLATLLVRTRGVGMVHLGEKRDISIRVTQTTGLTDRRYPVQTARCPVFWMRVHISGLHSRRARLPKCGTLNIGTDCYW